MQAIVRRLDAGQNGAGKVTLEKIKILDSLGAFFFFNGWI
jgi:hypothetical protein